MEDDKKKKVSDEKNHATRPYEELKEELAEQGIDADKLVVWLMGFGPFDADLSLDKKPEQKKEEEGETPPGWKNFFWSPLVSRGTTIAIMTSYILHSAVPSPIFLVIISNHCCCSTNFFKRLANLLSIK